MSGHNLDGTSTAVGRVGRHRRRDAAGVLGGRRRRASTCSSTTSSRSTASCRPASRCRSTASSGRSGPATRAPASTRDVFLIADGVLPARGRRGGDGAGHPGRARDVRAAAARHRGPPGASTPSVTRRSTSTDVERRLPAGLDPRRRAGVRSTSTSSTAPRAPTSTSPASPASPRRPATPRSCSTRCSTPACSAPRRPTPRR